VHGESDQQSHLDLKKRVRQILGRFRRTEQDPARDHDDQSELLPLSQRANQVARGNIGQRPAEESQVRDQDQSAEYCDAREMRRQHNWIHEPRFTDGGEEREVLNALADQGEAHAIQVNA
jgi:hypothetical protein